MFNFLIFKKLSWKAWGYAVTLIVPVIYFLRLVFSRNGIPLYGDMQFPMNVNQYAANFNSMWNPHGSQSNLQEIDRLLFIQPILHVLSFFNIQSTNLLSKLVLIGLLMLAGVCSFYFAKSITRKYNISNTQCFYICTAFAVSYESVPWVMSSESAYFYLLSYALLPLIVGLTLRIDKNIKFWKFKSVLLGFLIAVASSSPQYTIFIYAIEVALFVWSLRTKKLDRFGRPFALALLAAISFSLYWIIPTYLLTKISQISPGYILSSSDTIIFSHNASLINVLSGYSSWVEWWQFPSWWNSYFMVPWRIMSLIPFGASVYFTILFFRKNKIIRVTSITCISTILLCSGSNSFFWPIYRWLEFDSPISNLLGWVIRDPWKFQCFLFLQYFIIILYGYLEMHSLKLLSKHKNYFFVFITALFLISTLPENIYGYYTAYSPVKVPSYYQSVSNYLKIHKGSTLWIAPYGAGIQGAAGTVSYTWNKGKQAPFFSAESMPGTVFGSYHFTNFFEQEYQYLISDPSYFSEKLVSLGIKNVVLVDEIVGARNSAMQLFDNFKTNQGLNFVNRFGDAYVFSVKHTSAKRLTPSFVLGGRSAEDQLFSLDLINSNSALIFSQQSMINSKYTFSQKYSSIPLFSVDSTYDDLVTARIIGSYPSSFSKLLNANWEKVSTAESTSGLEPWHTFASYYFNGFDNWDFDYGIGVFASGSRPANTVIKKTILPGKYVVLIRDQFTPSASMSKLIVGTKEYDLISNQLNAGMHWRKVAALDVDKKIKYLKLKNIDMGYAINDIIIVPKSTWTNAETLLKNEFNSRSVALIYSCFKNQNMQSNIYLPNVNFKIRLPRGRTAFLDNTKLTNDKFINVSSGLHRLFFVGNCNYSIGFKNSVKSNSKLMMSSSGETWDPYWQYYSSDNVFHNSVQFNGVIGGGLSESNSIKFRYRVDSLLHQSIFLSLIAVLCLLFVSFFNEFQNQLKNSKILLIKKLKKPST